MKPRHLAIPLAALVAACTSHTITVAPIEVKAIHMTMDINLKVQRELEKFFDFEDEVTGKDTPASRKN